MQFRDLKSQYQALKPDIDAAMLQVATDCNFIGGKQVKDLEAELATYVGRRHCITCANGTDALTLSLMAYGIGAGDAVFVPDFTFFASGETVSFVGATPIFVDVCKDTCNLDAEKLEEAIVRVLADGKLTPRMVIAVDLFGLPANFPKIMDVAQKYNLLVLEDGAQGFGGKIGNQVACSFGDISTTSFFPAKPLGCYGDGGAIFTDDDTVAALLRSYCAHGKGSDKYDNVRIGVNSRLDTMQAAILQIKLKAFAEYELRAVNQVAKWYTERLKGKVETPVVPGGYLSSWAQYTIRLQSKAHRDAIQAQMKGIPTMVYYAKPMQQQGAFADIADMQDACEVTQKLCDTVLSLPIHPYLTEEMVTEVTNCITAQLGLAMAICDG